MVRSIACELLAIPAVMNNPVLVTRPGRLGDHAGRLSLKELRRLDAALRLVLHL